MKNYNKSFKVEITANMIADKLMSNLDPKLDENRREKFVDCIVGPMCSNDNSNGLKHLYYGLFDLDMDAPVFKDTDDLMCDHTYYGYVRKFKDAEDDSSDRIVEFVRERTPIGPCRLIGFDPYRSSNKYEIEYLELDSKGETSHSTMWVEAGQLELASDNVNDNIAE